MQDSQTRDDDPASVQGTEAGFGERVRETRLAKKWSQKQLAEKLDLDASAISRLEQGTRAIRLGEAALIARVLDVDLDFLVYGDLDPAAALRRARTEADRRMHLLRRAASDMAGEYLEIVDLLSENPELFGNLGKAEDGDESTPLPTTVDEYMEWVRKRVHAVYAPEDDYRRVFTEDETIAREIMMIVTAAVENVVSTIPFPESELGEDEDDPDA
ncbi:helix-turn-helix domain-containing protein [Mycolicibacterium peregrinum]|uniref:helix-turn-helix domain-containing protein n=1 Tax=Mycolicibacterium peregrinum TaxID=43304 RepID=UPI0012FFA6C4|nr:helix-turn-helix transcriptional regulator [Mycolicibacterium peregrinum]